MCKDADCILFVYSKRNPKTFKYVNGCISRLTKYSKKAKFCLIGYEMHADGDKEISTKQGKVFNSYFYIC